MSGRNHAKRLVVRHRMSVLLLCCYCVVTVSWCVVAVVRVLSCVGRAQRELESPDENGEEAFKMTDPARVLNINVGILGHVDSGKTRCAWLRSLQEKERNELRMRERAKTERREARLPRA